MKKTLLVLSLFVHNCFATPISDELQTRLNNIHSMTANFSQIVKAGKKEVSRSNGTMAMSRPGKFRWQTLNPMEQLVVADSNNIWVYDIELEQATVKKQEKGIGGTPALFLSGYDNTVSRDFEVRLKESGPNPAYELKAKSHKENYQRLILRFKEDQLTGIDFFDQMGQHTVVNLTKIKKNPDLPSKLFTFKPPKGIDIIKQ